MPQYTRLRNTLLRLCLLAFLLSALYQPVCAQQGITVNGAPAVISSSSFCDEFEDIQFDVNQAFNGRVDRPWMAAVKYDPQYAEWVKITFVKPTTLAALRIAPGFGHTNQFFYKYSRLKRIKVILDDGATETGRVYTRQFDGVPYKDMVLVFSTQPRVKSITIRILDVYPGTEMSNPLIGEIEPILVRDGRIVATPDSEVLRDVLEFLRLSSRPGPAMSYLSPTKPITLKKTVQYTNPLDNIKPVSHAKQFTLDTLKKNQEMWKEILRFLASDYRFNTVEMVSFFWKDPAKGHFVFDMVSPGTTDVMNSYMINLVREKVTETIRRPVKSTAGQAGTAGFEENAKEIVEKVTRYKSIITQIALQQDVYTP